MKLRITQTDTDPIEVEVPGDELSIGRSSECDVVLPSPYVSKTHLRLIRGLVVVDLGSSNGTFCAAGRVEGVQLVTDGRVSIGSGDVLIDVAEEEGAGALAANAELHDLRGRHAGLEHELSELKNENDYLRLRLETLEKANAKRDAVEALCKAQLEKEGKDFRDLDRLQHSFGELLERLNTEIDARMKKAAPF